MSYRVLKMEFVVVDIVSKWRPFIPISIFAFDKSTSSLVIDFLAIYMKSLLKSVVKVYCLQGKISFMLSSC